MEHEHNHQSLCDKVSLKKKDGIAVIEGEITLAAIELHKLQALQNLKSEFKHPGFRPGKVPESVILQHVSEDELFTEGAEAALKHAYPHLVQDLKLVPLTYPRVEVKKIEPGQPLEFKIEVGIIPEFKLPNYKSIAKGVSLSPEPVKDGAIEEVIKELETARSTDAEKFVATDENVSQIGKFENLADLKKKLGKHLEEEKTEEAKAKRREEIGRLLIEKTKFDLPKYWEDDERAAILGELEEHAGRHNIPKEKLLEGFKKTETQFLDEEIAFRAKNEKMKMILERIAEEEKIEPSEEEVEREAMNLRAYYSETNHERLKMVAKTALTRQKALEFLESLK